MHLDTWEIEEFSPDKIYFSKIPVDYVPDAGKPTMFNNYVDSCFKGNEAQKDLLQELFGYTLLKNYKYQNIFYLLGHGGNGKGIALSILGYLLGEHNYASESIHQLTDHLQVDYHVAKLHGKHANICGDISIKTIVNTETIKKLTSNTDPVAARNPYERPFSFVNYAKIIVALNRLPQTDAFTTGDKRRNLIISFNNKFSETDNEIKGLQCVIRDAGEMPGILLWAIEGLKRLEANQKFSDTRTIAQKAVEYEKKSRPARYYVEERLEELSGNLVPNALVYEDFNRFCVAIGAAELSQNEIKRSILQECYEAGWDVTNKITRVKSLPDLTQKLLP